jgi:hypothetical protein
MSIETIIILLGAILSMSVLFIGAGIAAHH